jgi:hypothetical protein
VKTTEQGNKKPAEKPNQPKKTTTKQKPQEVAMTAAAARTHSSTRVTLRITIQVEGKETAADKALKILSDMFTLIHSRDDSAILLPWKKADMAKKAISDTAHFPKKLTDIKVYADKFRPKTGNFWVKLHWASNNDPAHLTSSDRSDNSDWFDDNQAGGYMCTVQGSDDPVSIGDMLFTGGFSDAQRIEEVTKEAFKRFSPQTEFLIGCRLRKNKDITMEQGNGYRNWTMAENQLVHIEADRSQAKQIKTLLYRVNNKKMENKHRPGGYNIRILPDKALIKTGNSRTTFTSMYPSTGIQDCGSIVPFRTRSA